MSKDYYLKNKEKWVQYRERRKTDPIKRAQFNTTRKIWRHGLGKNKERISKQKSGAKYYAKMKNEPEYKQKRIEYMKRYNQEHREHQKKIMKLHRSKPETKKKNAEYNKKYHEENPDVLLRNTRNYLNKLGDIDNLKWYQVDKQLRGWSKIIHKDCNETCQVCFKPSAEAHHILHKNKYPQLVLNRNNGIALCTRCHNQVHGKRLLESMI